MNFTKQELVKLSNLLFTGKWGFSQQEGSQVITPLINKMSQMITEMKKPKKK